MDKDTIVKACPVLGHGIENLHKKFCRSLKRSMFYGSVDVARSMLDAAFDICDNFAIIKLLKPPALILMDTAGFLF